MTAIDTSPSTSAGATPRAGLVSWPLIAALGILSVVAREVMVRVPKLADHLGDSDDAARIVEVREWLAGRSWFDLHTDRFGLADGLTSHWSRLVDAPIGGLIRLFGLFANAEQAELMARAAWPLLLLVPLFAILVSVAHRRGGLAAALFASFYAATCMPALEQFAAGRIDHHNVMIVCALGAILLAVEAYGRPALGWAAGALAGLGLSVGFEGIVLTAALLAALVGFAILDGRRAEVAARVVAGAALVMALALVATTAPSRLTMVVCDALSLNLVLAISLGAAGVAVMARRFAASTPLVRLLVLAPFGLAAAAAYGVSEPACLAGPFAKVLPLTRSYWLDHVMETESILAFGRNTPAPAVSAAVFLALAVLLQVAAWWRARGDAGETLLTVMLAVAAVLGSWQIKLMPYAVLLAGVPMALAVARLRALPFASETLVRAGFVLAVNLPILHGLVMAATPAAAGSGPSREECTYRSTLRPLAGLPAGRVLGPMDIGAFLVAETPHSVLAAPYHRLNEAIALQARLWTATDMAEAEQAMRAAGIAYVVTCAGLNEPVALAQTNPPGLRVLLETGRTPAFLEPIDLPQAAPARVFRVK